jgi:hypothetical protein
MHGEVVPGSPVGVEAVELLQIKRRQKGVPTHLAGALLAIGRKCAALPDVDARSPEAVAGYGDDGMWR